MAKYRSEKAEALAHYNKGKDYFNRKQYDDAIEAFKKSIAIRPDYAKAYVGMGWVHEKLGRYADAINTYAIAAQRIFHALKPTPKNADFARNRISELLEKV